MDVKVSDHELIETDRNFVLNSTINEFQGKNYFKINNTKINAKETARMIKEKFNL